MARKKKILHFAGHILGLDEAVLHLDDAILEFAWPILGFEPHILKFTKSKQFNALKMVSVGLPTDTFSVRAVFSTVSIALMIVVF